MAETRQPYAFTGDDPLNATDPLGLYPNPKPNCSSKSASKRVGTYTAKKNEHSNATRGVSLLCGVADYDYSGPNARGVSHDNGYGYRHLTDHVSELGLGWEYFDASVNLTLSDPSSVIQQGNGNTQYTRTLQIAANGSNEVVASYKFFVYINTASGSLQSAYPRSPKVYDPEYIPIGGSTYFK